MANILNQRIKAKSGGSNQRLAIMLGWLTKSKDNPIQRNIPSKDRSRFSQEKYKFFLEAPFEISNQCCNQLKKNPAHKYHKETGRNPITAQMASESRLRTQKWLENGCNGFHLGIPTSNPMSFWTEQDILEYIYVNQLPICSVYGNVVIDYDAMNMCEGQLTFADCDKSCRLEIFEKDKVIYKTTGCKRTGCVVCGFGCHIGDDQRFVMLKESHPNMYKLLDVCKNNGISYREAIDWINEHGKLNIKY